jgi:hypothetical protein
MHQVCEHPCAITLAHTHPLETRVKDDARQGWISAGTLYDDILAKYKGDQLQANAAMTRLGLEHFIPQAPADGHPMARERDQRANHSSSVQRVCTSL